MYLVKAERCLGYDKQMPVVVSFPEKKERNNLARRTTSIRSVISILGTDSSFPFFPSLLFVKGQLKP